MNLIQITGFCNCLSKRQLKGDQQRALMNISTCSIFDSYKIHNCANHFCVLLRAHCEIEKYFQKGDVNRYSGLFFKDVHCCCGNTFIAKIVLWGNLLGCSVLLEQELRSAEIPSDSKIVTLKDYTKEEMDRAFIQCDNYINNNPDLQNDNNRVNWCPVNPKSGCYQLPHPHDCPLIGMNKHNKHLAKTCSC